MNKANKNLTEAEIRAELTEVNDSIRNARAVIQSAEEKAAQAEQRAGELRLEYDNALNAGDKQAMDKALTAIADAKEAASVDPAVYRGVKAEAESLEERRQVLATAVRVLFEDAKKKEKEVKLQSYEMYRLTSRIDEYVHMIRNLNSLANKG